MGTPARSAAAMGLLHDNSRELSCWERCCCCKKRRPRPRTRESRPRESELAACQLRQSQLFARKSRLESDMPPICSCGNVFLDDAVFCRKCGAHRKDGAKYRVRGSSPRNPVERKLADVCECGNTFAPDAIFCRMCGLKRMEVEVAVDDDSVYEERAVSKLKCAAMAVTSIQKLRERGHKAPKSPSAENKAPDPDSRGSTSSARNRCSTAHTVSSVSRRSTKPLLPGLWDQISAVVRLDQKRRSSLDAAAMGSFHVRVFEEHYDMGAVLARGGFGTTYKATEKESGRTVVVKVPDDGKDLADFDELKDKTHPHVVRVFDFFVSDTKTFIVMELCEGGDLYHAYHKLIEKENSISATWCAAIFQQIIQGTVYLHNQFHQSHNDIKPENVLLDRVPKHGRDAPRSMIADFGCAALYDTGKGGDPRYCPVEVLAGQPPSTACDTWSLGVTLHELLTGDLPFIDQPNVSGWTPFMGAQGGRLMRKLQAAWGQMRNGEITCAPCPKLHDQQVLDLVQSYLQVDPEKRIRLQASLQHPWFKLADALHEHHPLPAATLLAHVTRAKNFKLREGLLEFVESKLQGHVLDYYQELWDQADLNSDGVLDRDEFAILWNAAPCKGEKPSAKEVFDVVDVDMSGDIQFDEFVAFAFDPSKADEETREQCLHSAFGALAGADGFVHLSDLEHLFSDAVASQVKFLFDEIDSEHSGSICYKAFSSYVLALCRP